MRRNLLLLIVVGMGISAGCGRSGAPDANVVGIQGGDKDMVAAVQQAKDSIGNFIDRFQHKDGDGFVIKFGVEAGNEKEFLWARVLSISNDTFVVEVADLPVKSDRVKKNQVLSLPRADAIDWAILKGKTIEGAFTDAVVKKVKKR
jgi:uncharacterized protein YegJ (DUF2314 family)